MVMATIGLRDIGSRRIGLSRCLTKKQRLGLKRFNLQLRRKIRRLIPGPNFYRSDCTGGESISSGHHRLVSVVKSGTPKTLTIFLPLRVPFLSASSEGVSLMI